MYANHCLLLVPMSTFIIDTFLLSKWKHQSLLQCLKTPFLFLPLINISMSCLGCLLDFTWNNWNECIFKFVSGFTSTCGFYKKIHNKGEKNACTLQFQRLNAYLERSLYPKDRLPVLLNFPYLPLLWKQKETRIIVWEALGRDHPGQSSFSV